MVASTVIRTIRYEFSDKPPDGGVLPVADGIYWLRMPLPFTLGHINLWLLEDDGGWAIVDTGVNTDVTHAVWRKVFQDVMAPAPVTRVFATHLHPDHSGCAGWLVDECGVELWMPREEYLLCRILVADTGRPSPDAGNRFYHAAGFAPEALHHYRKMFGMFGRLVSPPPESYRRLVDGDKLSIGAHEWEVVVGRGHSPEHACLWCRDRNLLISGDQLLPTISSNVSVYPTEPASNPLAEWIESLEAMRDRIPADVLVLPAHGRPFRGAHERLTALIDEHRSGLEELAALCREPKRAVDVFPVLFRSPINESNLIMATGEAVAHLNYLLARGRLTVEADEHGVNWYSSL